ncbi:MAG: type VI secretion system baseplate subunit TssE [Desulfobacteraceae bacterium]|nr:type VI secretion system baseplate subunit TssE [Desulfobacteraceae bacterium]
MREHRLLERIRLLEQNPSRRMTEDPGEMIHSVQKHLQSLLNTRHGNVPIADDYGIPDFTNLMNGFLESKRSVEQTIRNTITKYEPRLQGVRVTFLDQEEDKLTLRFQISAQLAIGEHGDPVMFESVLDSGGKFTVKN